ncbi:efflux RND transporter periplasmic adaptor subunit [Mesorhizobium sp. B2-9-1]|uniref:efflux RND transporter periplasmic adaptor subunit n=1 Tax=unclassified Mesorhizobium TaxID=325217 RepID=UPI00112E90A7|nr:MULTISPECIES: efflux RND transporter periplasmic adaptor subunit [unclassified Mesorhizobium]TPI46883.1 efflux RND transporter periplasmic adaptor subunit [Mesorhizobium sp. B2-9-1]TPJ27279.1 efflux RND transporter periplasmic adaptor subunit [Mesorhizobium sp. B2-7-2]
MRTIRSALANIVLIGAAGLVAVDARAADFIVKAAAITEMKAVYGQVESRTILPARARISGTVASIRVSEGVQVSKGDVIATVVDDKLALQLRAADAKIAALNSQLDSARTDLQRAQDLLAKGAAAQSRVDAAKTQFDVVTNQLAAAIAEKAVIEQSSREGDILAPADGRVLTVPVATGSVIMTGEPAARVASGQYYLRLSLPERHAVEITEGARVDIGERGTGTNAGFVKASEGRIAKIYPEIENGRVIADVEVVDIGTYFVNERTLVSIPVAKRTILGVPPEALRTVHGIDYVTVETADGPLEAAVVLGGEFQDAGQPRVEILSGVADGDKVVLP